MKEIELIYESENDMISAMSFVTYPAIETDLLYFNKDKSNYTFGVEDKEQGIIVSPALIAEKRIYRFDPITNEEYEVYFSAETIKTLSQNFLRYGKQNETTEQHVQDVNGIYMIYSWLVHDEHDQIISKYGFKNITPGSWCVAYKIENDSIKEKIKNGEIRGLSIEAFLTEKLGKTLSKDEKIIEEIKTLLNTI